MGDVSHSIKAFPTIEMLFENTELICEVAKHLDGDLTSLIKVNKGMNELKNDSFIKNELNNFYNRKAIIIQDRFRKYIDKIDFIDGISKTGNVSLSRLNTFLKEEFCLLDKHYLSYDGCIGQLLLDIGACHQEISSFGIIDYEVMYPSPIDTLQTFKSLLNEYLV